MQWSPQQDAALKAVHEWLNGSSDQQVFRLFGYAGTGKTTLAQHFAEGVEGRVLFAAYTGKAAHVLQQKGCLDACTIHSLIYQPQEKSRLRLLRLERELTELRAETPEDERNADYETAEQRLVERIREERDNLSQPAFSLNPESDVEDAALLIIDECSMVDGRMGEDLLSFGTKILVLGDPAQLPPVGGGGFFTEHEPHVMLTEIHRQAEDNPIIHLATLARRREPLPLGDYGSSRVLHKIEIGKQIDPLQPDQILVGRNLTRRGSNRRIRELLGIETPTPVLNDRVVCLRNDHELGLLNGSMWTVADVADVGLDTVHMTVEPADSMGAGPVHVEAHLPPFLGQDIDLPWFLRKEQQEFDYGYALTVHKAQGSQWDDVLLFDEAFCFRDKAHRWLYTAITRAAERVTIVKGM